MPIVNSQFTVGSIQVDGRVYVLEVHTDHIGKQYFFEYLAAQNADFTSIMNSRAVQLLSDLISAEVVRVLNTDSAPVLVYATLTQLGTYVRNHYKDMSGIVIAQIANWIVNRISEGTFTDAQVRNFFSLTLTQYNNLKAKWLSYQTELNDLDAAVGE